MAPKVLSTFKSPKILELKESSKGVSNGDWTLEVNGSEITINKIRPIVWIGMKGRGRQASHA